MKNGTISYLMGHMVGKLMTTGSQPDGRCHARSTGLGTIWVKTFGFETLRPLPQKYLRFIFSVPKCKQRRLRDDISLVHC